MIKNFEKFVNEKFDYTKQKGSIKMIAQLKEGNKIYHVLLGDRVNDIKESKILKIETKKNFRGIEIRNIYMDDAYIRIIGNGMNEVPLVYSELHELEKGIDFCYECFVCSDYEMLKDFVAGGSEDIDDFLNNR